MKKHYQTNINQEKAEEVMFTVSEQDSMQKRWGVIHC